VTRNSWFTETEVFLLHEIVARLDRLARKRVLDAIGLSYAEFVLAMAVNEMERPTQAEVGELLDMSKSLVSQRVSSLLTKGYLIQQREPENRRQVRLDLTAAGRQTLEKIYEQLACNAAKIFEVLGPSRRQFLQSLRRLRDAIATAEASQEDGKPSTLR
jgi:DNA-binding MarR family transcriptional regulator